MLNHICVMGRLTRDPELRYTQSNIPVVSFTVACDRDYAQQGQERQADFIDVVGWCHTAEFVNTYFQKGRMAVVSGRLQSRKWQDRDGNNRTSWEIVADSVYFGEKKSDSQQSSQGGYGSQSSYGGQGGYSAQGNPYGAPSQGYNPPPRAGEYNPPAPSGFTELDDDDGELPF